MTRDHRRTDELAAEVDHVPCPECGAGSGVVCTNRWGQTSRVPCVKRLKAARDAAAVEPDATGNQPSLPAPDLGGTA